MFSVEQAFVGSDEKQAPLKTPAWEAKGISLGSAGSAGSARSAGSTGSAVPRSAVPQISLTPKELNSLSPCYYQN